MLGTGRAPPGDVLTVTSVWPMRSSNRETMFTFGWHFLNGFDSDVLFTCTGVHTYTWLVVYSANNSSCEYVFTITFRSKSCIYFHTISYVWLHEDYLNQFVLSGHPQHHLNKTAGIKYIFCIKSLTRNSCEIQNSSVMLSQYFKE